MVVEYLGPTDPLTFIHGKQYQVISIEYGLYRIVDETDDDYLYPPAWFKTIDDNRKGVKEIGGYTEMAKDLLALAGTYHGEEEDS